MVLGIPKSVIENNASGYEDEDKRVFRRKCVLLISINFKGFGSGRRHFRAIILSA